MTISATRQAEELLREVLKEFESPKGNVLAGVQKLSRAARMLNDEDVHIWCQIQLGNLKYVGPLKQYAKKLIAAVEAQSQAASKGSKPKTSAAQSKKTTTAQTEAEKAYEEFQRQVKVLDQLGLKQDIHYPAEEVMIKASESGGGYMNIGEVEEMYADVIRTKSGNISNKYFQLNMSTHINYVRKASHDKASLLYNKIAFSNTPQTSLDILRAEVDSKLLDLAPELAEKLMTAFKAVVSNNPEEWSQALTTCRRFIEDLADALFPPRDENLNGKPVGKTQYINRLWAFMDTSIQSESNKDLAKTHIDYLGSYLERTHKITNKGVHAELTRIEAVKAVFHTYLLVADILDYLKKAPKGKAGKLNIHAATLDELESVLDISRNLAKEIIRLRVEYSIVDLTRLATVKGIGPKIISKAKQVLSFEPVP